MPLKMELFLLDFMEFASTELVGAICQDLYYLLEDEKHVYFAFGTVKRNGIRMAGQGMPSFKFYLNIAGYTPSSNRLFNAIVSPCFSVIISDDTELPFEDVLDCSEFCVFVHASDEGYLNLLCRIRQEKWTTVWEKLKEITPPFESLSIPGWHAVDMKWRARAREEVILTIKHSRGRTDIIDLRFL